MKTFFKGAILDLKRFLLIGIVILILGSGLAPIQAQQDCNELIAQAARLLQQAEDSATNGDLPTSIALINASRALLAPCLDSCPVVSQVDLLLEQAAQATDTTNIEALIVEAEALLQTCNTEPPSDATYPTGEIAFMSDREGNNEIYLMNADGSNVRRLTNDPADDGLPVWSPDGTQVAFISDRADGTQIFVMNADGSNLRQVTKRTPGFMLVTWSPDGQQMVAVSINIDDLESEAETMAWTLCVMNSDGSDVRQIVTLDPLDMVAGLSWSVTNQIVYSDYINIWVVNPDGTEPRNLTHNPYDPNLEFADWLYLPLWSPEGQQIVYARMFQTGQTFQVDNGDGTFWDQDEMMSEIMIMNADGSGQRVLLSGSYAFDVSAWSPDGQWMAGTYYPLNPTEDSDSETSEICVIRANGDLQTMRCMGNGEAPSWRPN